jgi:hypothetical protein
MYVRTSPIDQKQYLVTEDEIAKIEHEWLLHHENQANQPQRTDKEYEHLFNMPLSISVNRTRPQSLIDKLSCKNPVPVRWVLGSWCKAYCKRIAGHPSCSDVAGEYGSVDCLPTVPAGDKLACASDEFSEWWHDHHTEEDGLSGMDCDCHLELYINGKWTNAH